MSHQQKIIKTKKEVLIIVSEIYNKLYDIYKSKYGKNIDTLSSKNKKKLDNKQLRFSDDYWYTSEGEQEKE